MAQANGVVTAEAKAAFVHAVTLDDTTVSAHYYLGIAAEQDGNREKAAQIFRNLIAAAQPGAHWVGTVRTALARVESKAAPSTRLPGPTPAEMLAAAQQPPAQQNTTIHGMVDRLAEQLKKDGSDPGGWAQLVRSYKVLGEADKQKAAVAGARSALASDPAKLKQFEAALKDIEKGPTPTVGAAASPPPPAAAPLPSPTPAQKVAEANQSPMMKSDMVQGMVGRLAERLKKDGSDPKGWAQLVRSYKVMGEADLQKAAVADARKALASDPAKLKQFEAELKDIESGVTPAPAPAGKPPHGAGGPPASKAGQHEGASIDSMVESLHEKLKKSGDNPGGWLMLTRSYLTMKQNDKAMAVIAEARKALAASPDKLQQYEEALKHYKIDAPK
jgi:cytochrome c-type biogenesis protein CcmH/NrfG